RDAQALDVLGVLRQPDSAAGLCGRRTSRLDRPARRLGHCALVGGDLVRHAALLGPWKTPRLGAADRAGFLSRARQTPPPEKIAALIGRAGAFRRPPYGRPSSALFPGRDPDAPELLGRAGLRDPAAVRHGSRRWHAASSDHIACAGAEALARGLRAA